jgi:hypothetical protein
MFLPLNISSPTTIVSYSEILTWSMLCQDLGEALSFTGMFILKILNVGLEMFENEWKHAWKNAVDRACIAATSASERPMAGRKRASSASKALCLGLANDALHVIDS